MGIREPLISYFFAMDHPFSLNFNILPLRPSTKIRSGCIELQASLGSVTNAYSLSDTENHRFFVSDYCLNCSDSDGGLVGEINLGALQTQ